MPKSTTSRASVRQEVQPALTPSGLTVQASPTGMSIPHGDYRPHVSADQRLIANAFATLAETASGVARDAIVKQRKEDEALGTQFRLEAGDNAVRAIDTANKSVDFIRGYDYMHGRLGAAKAAEDIQAEFENNPDQFLTQGRLQGTISARIQEDLKGVDSPEMRAAYLQGMVPFEASITAKNAKYQAVVAHTEQLDNYSAVVKSSFMAGIENKDATDLSLDREAMVELGVKNGFSMDEINTIMVKTAGEQAVATGNPELMKAFSLPTQDVNDPNKTVPPLDSSTKFRDSITEYTAKAQRAKDAFEADQLESRQNAAFKALDAEPNYATRLQMVDKYVENHTLSAEKAAEFRKKWKTAQVDSDVNDAFEQMANSENWAGMQAMVASGLIKQEKMNKYLDARDTRLLTYFHEHAKDNPVQATQALRKIVREKVGTDRKSKVLERELNPAIDNRAAFENAIAMSDQIKQQGAAGETVLASHINQTTANQMLMYRNMINGGHTPDEAYAAAKSYGTPDAIKVGQPMAKFNKAVGELVDSELDSFDPGWTSWEYDMAGTEAAKDIIRNNVAVAVTMSGGLADVETKTEEEIERFKAVHTAYKPDGADKGVWLYTGGADQEITQNAVDYVGKQIATSVGREGASLFPEHQPGIGYVWRDANTYEVMTVKGNDKNGNPITVPVITKQFGAMVTAYENSQHMTKEETFAAQAEAAQAYAGRVYAPGDKSPAARNWRQQQANAAKAKLEEANALRGGGAVDQNVPPQAVSEQPAPAADVMSNPVTSFIASEENNKANPRGGWDKAAGLWKPHVSPEGGNRTLAYGHKLTNTEKRRGTVIVDGKHVNFKEGLTDAQANALLKQDTAKARAAVDSLVTVDLTADQKTALTSLVFNVGIDSFKKSNAREALNRGDMEEFRKQAFSREHGWVHAAGKVNETLVKRRQREAKLFFGK